MSTEPVVDLAFSLTGSRVPLDHGYGLYAALCAQLRSLHEAEWLGIHPIGGMPLDRDTLRIGRSSELRLRLPAARIRDVLPIAGKALDVGGATLRVGVPVAHALAPATMLDARLVLIKLTDPAELRDPVFAERYVIELRRQLERLDIDRPLELCGRRRLRVGRRRLVGFSVRVGELDEAESLRLQAAGLGGKRRMGCGLFRPSRGGG